MSYIYSVHCVHYQLSLHHANFGQFKAKQVLKGIFRVLYPFAFHFDVPQNRKRQSIFFWGGGKLSCNG